MLKKITIRDAMNGMPGIQADIRGIVEPAKSIPLDIKKIETVDSASAKCVDKHGDDWQMINLSELARETSGRATGRLVTWGAKRIGIAPADAVAILRVAGIVYRMVKARI